jgi:hypothetical protein
VTFPLETGQPDNPDIKYSVDKAQPHLQQHKEAFYLHLFKKIIYWPSIVAQICNPNYCGEGRYRNLEDLGSRLALAKVFEI